MPVQASCPGWLGSMVITAGHTDAGCSPLPPAAQCRDRGGTGNPAGREGSRPALLRALPVANLALQLNSSSPKYAPTHRERRLHQ